MSEDYQQTTESERTMLDLVRNRRFLDLERVPLICNDIAEIRKMMELQNKRFESLVTQDQFWPIKTLVYGFVGLMLVAVIGALMALIIKQ